MSRRSATRWFTLAFTAVGLAWYLAPECSPKTPEDQVRAVLYAVAGGLDEGRLDRVMEAVSPAYLDAEGFDAAAVRGLLFRELHARGPIHVLLGTIDVTVDGERAEAHFPAMLLQGLDLAALDLRANDAQAWTFDVDLALTDGDWLITGHTRRDVEPQDVFR